MRQNKEINNKYIFILKTRNDEHILPVKWLKIVYWLEIENESHFKDLPSYLGLIEKHYLDLYYTFLDNN